MNGRRIARPAATRLSAVAMLAAMTVVTVGAAGPASAAARSRPAVPARQHKAAARHQAERTRAVTLTTLVHRLAVRNRPTSASRLAGRIENRGARVTVSCYTKGARVAGNPIWYQVSKPLRGYVTSYYINSHNDPATGVKPCADLVFSRTYRTLVGGVHIRIWPTANSTRLTTLGRMGSRITVNCYVLGQKSAGDPVWYHSTRPKAGFVAGSLLNTGRDPAYKVPACW
jgi:hypothetical protein